MKASRLLVTSALLVGLAVAVAMALAWRSYDQFIAAPLPMAKGEPFVIVAPGMNYAQIVDELGERGLVERRWQWWLLGRVNPAARQLQAGEYRLHDQLTPSRLLDMMARGEVVQHLFTIIEGWRFSELRQALAENPLIATAGSSLDDLALARQVDPGLDHPEGWFLPETYHFTRGSSEVELLTRAYRAMQSALADAWRQRQPDLPLETPYEVLVLASIVEKETAVAAERPQVAGVFVRRLNKRMRLQTDPTVIYGLGGAFDGDLRRRDLRKDTPYNTYTRFGLPPTPIALPGRDALLAVVQPADGDALYFVARGDGSHQFSATLDEHNRAVNRYQRGL